MYRFSTARSISQFKIPVTDCIPKPLPEMRRIRDPKACLRSDKGLTLGVYYNEHVHGEPAVLTAAATKYDKLCGGRLWKSMKLAPTPRLGEVRVFYDLEPTFAFVALAGLGSECLAYNHTERLDEAKDAIRTAAGAGAAALAPLQPKQMHFESFGNAEAAAEGAVLAHWHFDEYKSVQLYRRNPKVVMHLYDDCNLEGWRVGQMKAEAQNLARYLQEMPANLLNPTTFAKIAVEILCELDINVEVKTQGWAANHEMGGFVAIGKSSIQPPLYVEISYYGTHERSRPVVLIGKGVTFDSGSLDLKSCEELRHMRGDMAGAACVLAVTRAAARLRLPLNIRGILPLCELMPSGKSPKFGDIVPNASGQSIHIRLPSREGRLLIADSLVYARNYWPKVIVDVGTMSQELVEALDGSACGAYTNCEELYRALECAGAMAGDRVWRMPLWSWYARRVRDCSSADLANTGRAMFGDSPNCAAFLGQFVCDTRWLHLDTYNVAYSKGLDVPYLRRGMTGRPTRTILEFLNHVIEQ